MVSFTFKDHGTSFWNRLDEFIDFFLCDFIPQVYSGRCLAEMSIEEAYYYQHEESSFPQEYHDKQINP